MADTLTPVLTSDWADEQSWKLATYERNGGYSALRTALGMAPDDIITAVKASGLRGRGGAGFPTGTPGGESKAAAAETADTQRAESETKVEEGK